MATRRTTATNQERTPLIARRQRQFHHDPYSPLTQDLDKEDRRSILGRVSAASASLYWFLQNNANSFSNTISSKTPAGDRSTPGTMTSSSKNNEEDFYEDTYNDLPWRCSFGTREDDGIWMNRNDQAGVIMSFIVWLLIIYSAVTVTLLTHNNHLPGIIAVSYSTICALALASHAKTTFTDPGSIPQAAVPRTMDTRPSKRAMHAMCSHCQTYKPPLAHHCRICNRCISRMDHHCPWMNNCVGIGNLKHFILFLAYTWIGSVSALLIFAWNYFLCLAPTGMESCSFSVVIIQLVRAMTFIAVAACLFTSSMLTSAMHGVMTGIGTIDRLKHQATNKNDISASEPCHDEGPIPLRDIFGIEGYWTWWLPLDPVFEDYDRIFGYSTPQRLLREKDQNDGDFASKEGDYSPAETDSRGYSQV